MLLLLGVVVLVSVGLWYFDYFGQPAESYMYVLPAKNAMSVRPSLFVTYTSYDTVPSKVWDGLSRYARDYTLRFFDDDACTAYLAAHFHPDVLARYQRLAKGAHRADLWRYCVLYREGGLYLDVKTDLLRPVSSFLPAARNATVLSVVDNSIYQGILSVPMPNDPLLGKCIADIMKTPRRLLDGPFMLSGAGYLKFTRAMYAFIMEQAGGKKLVPGHNGNWYLLEEQCDPVCTEPDRYGRCCHILSAGVVVANTRYKDFPWDKK